MVDIVIISYFLHFCNTKIAINWKRYAKTLIKIDIFAKYIIKIFLIIDFIEKM